MIEPQEDEPILDDEQDLDKEERQGPEEEVVNELVEHKRFLEQGVRLAEKDDQQAAKADMETSDAPVVDSTWDVDSAVDAHDADPSTDV